MKSLLATCLFLGMLSFESKSQDKYTIPEGYTIFTDYDNRSFRIDNDLDGDGINDLAIVLAKKEATEEENVVVLFLSTSYNNVNSTYYTFPFYSNAYNMEFKNKVLTIGACFGTGRFCKKLKFKYYPTLKNLRLIGYDEESFGNAAHEGAYLKSVNLLTNKYELSGPMWKSKLLKTASFPVITVAHLDEKSFDYLEEIGAAYLNE